MRIVDLAVKDLWQLARDWKSALFLVIMPILFTLMFGFVFGGFGGQEDPRLPVGLLDRDEGPLSEALVDLLGASEGIRPVWLDETADADAEVREAHLAAVVTIPTGYGEQVLAGEAAALSVLVDTASTAGNTALAEIQTAASRAAGAAQAARLSAEAYAGQADLGGEAREQYLEEGLSLAAAAWGDPPLVLETTQSGETPEEEGIEENAFAHSSPSMLVQFSMGGLMGAATILVLERKSRSLQRLLTTAISRWGILLGHFLAMFVMILLQVVLLAGFGQLFLHVGYLRQPLAVAAVMLAISLWTAALGLLIGVVAKSDEQVIMLALITMLALSGVGGVWVPLEFSPESFQRVAHVVPTAWAMEGLKDVIVRGQGLAAVLPAVGVMGAYAVVLFGAAAWRFRRYV